MNERKYSSLTPPTPDEPLPPADGVNLDKPSPAESSPTASEGVPGGTGAAEGAGGRGADSEPPEGRSESRAEDDNDWIAFLPLGITFTALGVVMENGIPFFAAGLVFLVTYLFSAFKQGDRNG